MTYTPGDRVCIYEPAYGSKKATFGLVKSINEKGRPLVSWGNDETEPEEMKGARLKKMMLAQGNLLKTYQAQQFGVKFKDL